MSDEQQQLVAGSVNTDSLSGTVFVVTCRRDGDPHCHVEAVYDNEDAAEAHKRDIADDSFGYGAIAWGVHEMEIDAGFVEADAE